MKLTLGSSALKLIGSAIDKLFDSIRGQVLGGKYRPNKRLYIAYKPTLTLTDIFNQASSEEGVSPNEEARDSLLEISSSYLDATQAKAKAKITQKIQSFLHEASTGKIETDLQAVLTGQLYETLGETTRDIKRILETESTIARNVALSDGIGRNAASVGIEDPSVYFVIVRDGKCCGDCLRLHMLSDEITPRVWKQSELQSGYWKRGSDTPSVSGIHPHCRCSLTSVYPGFGFNTSGMITYIKPGHDEYRRQKGLEAPKEDSKKESI
jgi:hypothetical protein